MNVMEIDIWECEWRVEIWMREMEIWECDWGLEVVEDEGDEFWSGTGSDEGWKWVDEEDEPVVGEK